MSRRVSDDEFDRRLRDVLHSRALSITPDVDAIDRIHAGARRRQRRQRVAVSGSAALAVIAVATVGITLRPAHHNGSQLAGGPSSTAPSTASSTLSKAPSPAPSAVAPSATNKFTASAPSSSNYPAIPAGGTPPKGFVPMSVTAVNESTYWVFGHAPCASGECPAVAKTSDKGSSFTEVGAPGAPVGPDLPQNSDLYGSGVLSDIRFGDGKNGWAFGGAFWQTTDGGLTWSRVVVADSTPQFDVERLAAANNRAWAIVLTSASSDTGPVYNVYSATYPGGAWQKVDSAGAFGSAEPLLGVEGTTAVVIGTDATTGKQRAVIAKGGSTSFAPLPGSSLPCTYAPGDPLSTTTNALWLACASSGTGLSGAYVSPDFGTTWQTASSKLSSASVAIGAVDGKSAIIATGGKLLRVNADGSTASVTTPSAPSSTEFAFIGFTTAKTGFAIPVVNGTRQLWRTTDGGAHWSVVKF